MKERGGGFFVGEQPPSLPYMKNFLPLSFGPSSLCKKSGALLKARRMALSAGVALGCLGMLPAGHAGTGTWTNTAGGDWDTTTNWQNGDVAEGAGFGGLFNTLTLSAPVVVNLNASHTLGSLSFSGGSSTNTWTISSSNGSVLTLKGESTPTISTASDTIISTALAGTQGFTKSGGGILRIIDSGTISLFGGNVTVSQGILNVRASSNNGVFSSQLNNATVTLTGSGSFYIGSSAGAGAAIGGLNSASGVGSVTAAAGQILDIRGVSGDYSYGGTMNAGTLLVSLGGGGSQTMTRNLAHSGYTTVTSGRLISTTASLTGTPFSTGGVKLGTSTGNTTGGGIGAGGLVINSGAAAGSDVTLTGANAAVGTTFTYNNGSQLILDKKLANSLSYTVGNTGAAANSVLVRTTTAAAGSPDQGTLLITPASGLAAFGTGSGEKFIVNGGVATTSTNGGANTMVSASIIGKDNDTNKSGAFLTYDATNGFKVATVSASTDINGGTAYSDTRIFQATSGTTNALTANAAVYSLRVDGTTVSGAYTLSLGSNSATNPAAGIILNGGSMTVSTIALGDSPLVIYANAEGGTISSNITASGTSTSTAPGVAVTGPGVLTLTGTNTFHSLAINDGTVSVASTAALGLASSGTVGAGTITMRNGTLVVTENMSISDRQIDLNGTTAASLNVYGGSVGGTFDVAAGKTLTYTTGSNTNLKKYLSGDGSLEKKGAGTMVLAGQQGNIYTGMTIVSEGTLLLNGTAGKNMISSDKNSGDSLDLTDVQVKGGTLQWGASNQIIDSAKVALAGGVMDLNGKSEGSTAAAGLGFLNVFASSTLDFGEGDNANVVRFASINLHTAGTVLSILNWNGVKWLGGGSEQLLFGGLASEFTSLFGQNDVSFDGVSGYSTVQYSGYYEVVAVPEPATMALLGVTVLAGLRMVMRRRMGAGLQA